jgi:GNAT superfamily N-acetyltransferase
MSQIRIVNIEEAHCAALEALQRDCFPTLGDSELMLEQHFLSHCRIFPEGDFVALDGERVIALGSGFFTDFDLEHPDHSFQEIIAGGYYTNHDPDGAWYYGGDLSVHPDYRGRGIGRMLYEARKDLVRRYRRKGIVAGGLLPGFVEYKATLSAQSYVDKVVAGELYDSTLSFQLKNGFQVRGVLENYLVDSASDNWSSLIVWEAD